MNNTWQAPQTPKPAPHIPASAKNTTPTAARAATSNAPPKAAITTPINDNTAAAATKIYGNNAKKNTRFLPNLSVVYCNSLFGWLARNGANVVPPKVAKYP